MEQEGQQVLFGKQSIVSALLLPEGPLDLIARLTGLLGLLSILEIYNRFVWIRAEYRVPSWWLSDWCLDLPCPESFCIFIAGLSAAASLFMLAGYKGKLAPLVVALSIAYLSSLDLNIAFPHSYMLTIWICIALLLRRSGCSISRRLIQFSIVACYGFSALQKLFTPEFISGHSMAALIDGSALQSWLVPILKSVSISPDMWMLISILVVALESALALGLCFKRTRIAALSGVFLFQAAIFATMTSYIALLHFSIFVCCLSFFDRIPFKNLRLGVKQNLEVTDSTAPICTAQLPGRIYFAVAALAACCFVAFPLRMYFIAHAFERFSLMDRRPWTFCMYICQEGNYKTSISMRNDKGVWESISPRGRMKYLSSNAEMFALARYIERAAPPFEELRLESSYQTNGTFQDHKVLTVKALSPGRFEHSLDWARERLPR